MLFTLFEDIMARAKQKKQEALFVQLTPEQKKRYEAAANAAGITMRELVTNALDALVASQTGDIDIDLRSVQADDGRLDWMMRRLNAQYMRLGTLEQRVEALQRRVEREWGPDVDPLVRLPRHDR